jgi:hypothetical protein
MSRCRDFESIAELVLEHRLHFGGRIWHKARTSFNGLLGELRIEVVQPAITTEKQHLLGIPSQRLAFECLAFDARAKHEFSGHSESRRSNAGSQTKSGK